MDQVSNHPSSVLMLTIKGREVEKKVIKKGDKKIYVRTNI